ncbi:MAG: ClpP family protease [Campylobacterota bacterium]|nr:ClpP family protease [Campylobacterota bacterium]
MPAVIEESGRGLKSFSLQDKLFDENIILLEHGIDDDLATTIKAQLLYLDSKEDCKEINMYISSGGGSIYAGNGIIDVMRHIKTKVNTICTGMIASMGTQIHSAGTGTRKYMPNSRIMIHSLSGGTQGKFQDMEIDYHESKFLQEKLMNDLSSYTKGKTSYDEMCILTDRDKWLSPEEALEIGIADEIIVSNR